jgi:hypothetical protein
MREEIKFLYEEEKNPSKIEFKKIIDKRTYVS